MFGTCQKRINGIHIFPQDSADLRGAADWRKNRKGKKGYGHSPVCGLCACLASRHVFSGRISRHQLGLDTVRTEHGFQVRTKHGFQCLLKQGIYGIMGKASARSYRKKPEGRRPKMRKYERHYLTITGFAQEI